MIKTKDSPSQWLIFPQKCVNPKLTLFCFPYAGGGASIFRTWPKHLPDHIEICAVQLPGRENRLRDQPFTDLRSLAEAILEIMPPYLDNPFAFLGHSLGAVIAFELAHLMRRRLDLTPDALFVSARIAPHLPEPETVHLLSDTALLKRLIEYNGTPEHVLQNSELMSLLLPMIRADFEVNETYIFSEDESLSCPIFAFRGAQDKIMTYDEVIAWREQTTGSFTLRTIPGDHFFIHQSEDIFLQILAYDLKQLLQKQKIS